MKISLASQVILNYYLNCVWDSASFQRGKEEVIGNWGRKYICVTFLKTLQKAKWRTKAFFNAVLAMCLLWKWPEFPVVVILFRFCLNIASHFIFLSWPVISSLRFSVHANTSEWRKKSATFALNKKSPVKNVFLLDYCIQYFTCLCPLSSILYFLNTQHSLNASNTKSSLD